METLEPFVFTEQLMVLLYVNVVHVLFGTPNLHTHTHTHTHRHTHTHTHTLLSVGIKPHRRFMTNQFDSVSHTYTHTSNILAFFGCSVLRLFHTPFVCVCVRVCVWSSAPNVCARVCAWSTLLVW